MKNKKKNFITTGSDDRESWRKKYIYKIPYSFICSLWYMK